MKLPVMGPANWHGEFVAYSASECTRLGKGEVMRIRRHAAAHQARLPQHELPVIHIAQANRFAQLIFLDRHRSNSKRPRSQFQQTVAPVRVNETLTLLFDEDTSFDSPFYGRPPNAARFVLYQLNGVSALQEL